MEDVLVEMVRLREKIQMRASILKEQRAELRALTDQVLQYMSDGNIKTITNVAGEFTVSLVTSHRVPPMNLEFIQGCLLQYLKEAKTVANATDAANYVFEQRQAQKQAMVRIQVRKQNQSAAMTLTKAAEFGDEDGDDDEKQDEEQFTNATAFQF